MASGFIYLGSLLHFAVPIFRFNVSLDVDYTNNANNYTRAANAAKYDEIHYAADDALDRMDGSIRFVGLLGYGKCRQLCSTNADQSAKQKRRRQCRW